MKTTFLLTILALFVAMTLSHGRRPASKCDRIRTRKRCLKAKDCMWADINIILPVNEDGFVDYGKPRCYRSNSAEPVQPPPDEVQIQPEFPSTMPETGKKCSAIERPKRCNKQDHCSWNKRTRSCGAATM